MPYATLSIFYLLLLFLFFSTCPYLYICNSCILCTYAFMYMYIYMCMHVCMYTCVCICIYVYTVYIYIYTGAGHIIRISSKS